QLGGAACLRLGGALKNLLVGHHVALGRFQIGAERAEVAAVDADVGRVDVRVYVVIGEVAVLALADMVGELAEIEEIGLIVKKSAVVKGEPLAGFDLVANLLESTVSGARHIHGIANGV